MRNKKTTTQRSQFFPKLKYLFGGFKTQVNRRTTRKEKGKAYLFLIRFLSSKYFSNKKKYSIVIKTKKKRKKDFSLSK